MNSGYKEFEPVDEGKKRKSVEEQEKLDELILDQICDLECSECGEKIGEPNQFGALFAHFIAGVEELHPGAEYVVGSWVCDQCYEEQYKHHNEGE